MGGAALSWRRRLDSPGVRYSPQARSPRGGWEHAPTAPGALLGAPTRPASPPQASQTMAARPGAFCAGHWATLRADHLDRYPVQRLPRHLPRARLGILARSGLASMRPPRCDETAALHPRPACCWHSPAAAATHRDDHHRRRACRQPEPGRWSRSTSPLPNTTEVVVDFRPASGFSSARPTSPTSRSRSARPARPPPA